MNQDKRDALRRLIDTGRAHDVHADDIEAMLDALDATTDETPTHRREMEQARAEIARGLHPSKRRVK